MPFIQDNQQKEKSHIDDFNIDELADCIAQDRTDNAEVDDLKDYFYNLQYYSLLEEHTKEDIYKIYKDMGLDE